MTIIKEDLKWRWNLSPNGFLLHYMAANASVMANKGTALPTKGIARPSGNFIRPLNALHSHK
ncbi:hypothetical protein FRX31_007034 [Thalictrum thalictroides]|uniref:Uncharacterized protein n=1 Tax=Thalictrum thalictroides TaxID=46969 RepID=A0A7J6X3L9_THATH|nr:hypothetical protein FRX31_007034 [Thalictrum thalictroides]